MRWRVLAADAADMNPIDPNADIQSGGPAFHDNAQNSIEQEVALQTWVDHATDMLSRGATQQEVVSKLAHDGCPDPEVIYQRAVEHAASKASEFDSDVPEPAVPPGMTAEEPTVGELPPGGVTANADAQYSYPEKPAQNMGVQGVDDLKQRLMEAEAKGDSVTAQQLRDQLKTMWQGYTGSVRVANFEGKFAGMEFDNWGRLVVAVDTDNGVIQLDGEKAEPVSEVATDDVSEIQQFIDKMPETVAHEIDGVTARIAHLQEARSMVLTALGRADEEDLEPLLAMRDATAGAIKTLIASADRITTPYEHEYLTEINKSKFEVGAVTGGTATLGGFDSPDLTPVVEQMVVEASTYDPAKAAREDAAILVAELPELMIRDAAAIRDLAESVVMERTASMGSEASEGLVKHFCDAVEGHRAARASQVAQTAKTASVEAAPADNDGPAEALFY